MIQRLLLLAVAALLLGCELPTMYSPDNARYTGPAIEITPVKRPHLAAPARYEDDPTPEPSETPTVIKIRIQ